MSSQPSDSGAAALVLGGEADAPVMTRWVQIAFFLIATNAVLIQTIATDDSPVKNIIRVAVLVITVFFLFIRRTVFPTVIMGLIIVSAVFLLVTGNTDQFTVLYVMLFVPALWSIPERKLWKAGAIASIFALLLVFIFLRLGLTSNDLLVSQTYLSGDIRSRYSFGTQGVPFFMNLVYGAVATTMFYLYRWRIRGRLLISAAAVAVATYLFIQTDGRGGYTAIWLFVVFALLMRRMVKFTFLRLLLTIQPVLMLGFSLLMAYERGSAWWNAVFSFRPALYGTFLDSMNFWDIIHSVTVKNTADVTTVDSSALHLLYGGGLLVFIAFCIIFARAVSTLIKRQMHLELAFLTSVMMYSTTESILLRVENIFIMLAWYLILRYGLAEHEPAPRERSLPGAARTATL